MAFSSGDEWELISDSLIKDQDEAADFFARPVKPTISRLANLGIGEGQEEQAAPMDIHGRNDGSSHSRLRPPAWRLELFCRKERRLPRSRTDSPPPKAKWVLQALSVPRFSP